MYPKQSFVHLTRIFKHSNMCPEIQSFIWRSEKIKSSKCCVFITCIHSSIFIKTSIKSDSSSNYIYEEGALRRIFIFKIFNIHEEWTLRRIFISNFQHLWRMDSASYLHFKFSNIYEDGALRRIFIFKIFNIYEGWTLHRIFISNFPTFMKKGLCVVSSF